MSSFWSRLTNVLKISRSRKPVGYDLKGNAFYELPNPAGGRPKRVVEYHEAIAPTAPLGEASSALTEARTAFDYRQGTKQLPVQWQAWMSWTRLDPPTMAELQADHDRLSRLAPLVRAIEERERAERIEQGYLLPDGTEPSDRAEQVRRTGGSLAPPGKHASAVFPLIGKSGVLPQSIDALPHEGSEAASPSNPAAAVAAPSASTGKYHRTPRPTATTPSSPAAPEADSAEMASRVVSMTQPGIAPPREHVNPDQSASELRKLAEEDTRRRMRESGIPEETGSANKGVSGVGRGLKPRKRGSRA